MPKTYKKSFKKKSAIFPILKIYKIKQFNEGY